MAQDKRGQSQRQFKDYPNIIDPQSHSLFMLAGARGKLKTMKYLLTLGADLDYIQAKSGDDALSVALYFNEYDVADWLVEDKGMTLASTKRIKMNDEYDLPPVSTPQPIVTVTIIGLLE